MITALVNGEAVQRVGVMDRGLHYGDGLFETLACLDGRVQRLDAHLQRMRLGCDRLMLSYPGDRAFRDDIHALIEGSRDRVQRNAVIKIMLTRGIGQRGYRFDPAVVPTRISLLSDWPSHADTWWCDGIRVKVCNTPITENAQLAGIKHLNRLDSVLAAAELGTDYDEGLMLDRNGFIIEGTMSNLFARIDDTLQTPRTDACGIDGIMRDAVLQAARSAGIDSAYAQLTRAQLERASEIFVTNSVIGICPVIRLEDRALQAGEMTRRLQALAAA